MSIFFDINTLNFIVSELSIHVSVPTIAVVHSNLSRFFERALSMAGPTVDDADRHRDSEESSGGSSSVHSLQSFDDFDFEESGTDLSDREDSSPNKRVLVRS